MNALSMSSAFGAPRTIAVPGTHTTQGAHAAPATTAPTPDPSPAPARTSSAEDAPKAGGGDLLSAMNPAMDAAFAVGRPTNATGAAAILATTGAYVNGANQTINKLDVDLERRHKELTELRLTDPEAADKAQQQIDLLERLRDRIQLSIERVTGTGRGAEPGGGDDDSFEADLEKAAAKRRQREAEDLELLEQRRLLLGAEGAAAVAPADASMVAGTYEAARADA